MTKRQIKAWWRQGGGSEIAGLLTDIGKALVSITVILAVAYFIAGVLPAAYNAISAPPAGGL